MVIGNFYGTILRENLSEALTIRQLEGALCEIRSVCICYLVYEDSGRDLLTRADEDREDCRTLRLFAQYIVYVASSRVDRLL